MNTRGNILKLFQDSELYLDVNDWFNKVRNKGPDIKGLTIIDTRSASPPSSQW